MSSDEVYLTQEGYEKLVNDLEQLKTVKRREISKALAKARAYGDLSENAEYDAAKEAQAFNEKKISELEDTLARARIIEDEKIASDEVLIGAKVTLEDLHREEEVFYILVSPQESNFEERKISTTSPVGKALLGHKKGDVVEVDVPAGKLQYKIKEISR